MSNKNSTIITICLLTLVFACNKWELERASFLQIITVGVINVSATSAALLGDIEELRTGTIQETGFVLSTVHSQEASLRIGQDGVVAAEAPLQDTISGGQAFGALTNKLTPSTTYFFRAYAILAELPEPLYGEIQSFTTTGLDLSVRSLRRISGSCEGKVEITAGVAEGQSFDISSLKGIVWTVDADNPGVTIDGTCPAGGQTSRDQFTVEMDLGCDTTYFIRAFIEVGTGKVVSSIPFAFSTKPDGEWIVRDSPLATIDRKGSYFFTIGAKALMGGGIATKEFRKDLLVFDFNTNRWEETVVLDVFTIGWGIYDVFNAIGLSINGQGLVFSGTTWAGGLEPNTFWCEEFNWPPCVQSNAGFGYSCFLPNSEAFQFSVDEQENIAFSSYPVLDAGRFGSFGLKVGDRLFYGGGINMESNLNSSVCDYNFLDELLEIVPGEEELTVFDGSIPVSDRIGAVAIGGQNIGFVGLGKRPQLPSWPVYPGGPQLVSLKDIWAFDPDEPAGNRWKQLEDFPGLNAYSHAFSAGGKGYVLNDPGGNNGTGLWQFDPLADEDGDWREIGNIPDEIKNEKPLAATTLGNQGLIYFSGTNENFWMYVAEI